MQRRLNHELWEAAKEGKTAEIRRLLDIGADANSHKGNRSVLGVAGRSPHSNVETVRLLLERGALVNGDPRRKMVHPFALATHLSLNEIIQVFIEYGVDVNTTALKPGTGWTAFQELIGWANIETIRLMIERGADVNLPSLKGSTALHKAAGAGRPDIAALLLAHGADATLLNHAGESALDYAHRALNPPRNKRNLSESQEQAYRDVIALLEDLTTGH